MTPFQTALERHATTRRLVALLVILAAVMVTVQAIDVPWSLVHLKLMTGGVSILDMQPHYSAHGAYDLLTALGPAGRDFYLWRMIAATDLLLPALFACVLS